MAAWIAEAFSRLSLVAAADSVAKHSLASKSDETLLVEYREGNRESFVVLLERYRGELLNFLTKFLSNRAAAEDVFQETFLQVHLSAESFDATRTFKPWLFTIAANKARDFHRRQRRRATASLSAPVNGQEEGAAFIDLLDGGVEQPSAPVERDEEAALVKGVIERLPSHYREILLLGYFQRMSYQQIAEILEIPLGTVKSRLHSAVASFADGWRIAVRAQS
ncbi:MAG: sigma-70 family RNA polymerase sigma factor [Phycisphaerae bacterium]|nr:sigma-70 family RNA polymerase sigma factor [Phycisphaerae bacterium]